MCTVTFIPFQHSDYVLTQNRDVSTRRPKAEPPDYHDYRGRSLFYPIDVKGGGTWNAVSSSHQAFILNGADYDYYPNFEAPKSRGSLCLDLLVNGKDFMENHDFADYDDFTLVYFPRDRASDMDEWRWNSEKLLHRTRPIDEPYMWISRGMYTRDDFNRKRHAFHRFLKDTGKVDLSEFSENIWSFHHRKLVADLEGFLISRAHHHLGTVSVVQVMQEEGVLTSRYEDRTDFYERPT